MLLWTVISCLVCQVLLLDTVTLTHSRGCGFTNQNVSLLKQWFTLTHLLHMLGMNHAIHIVSLLRYDHFCSNWLASLGDKSFLEILPGSRWTYFRIICHWWCISSFTCAPTFNSGGINFCAPIFFFPTENNVHL